jgi:hypothetical protein
MSSTDASIREEYEREMGVRITDAEWHRVLDETVASLVRKGLLKDTGKVRNGERVWGLTEKGEQECEGQRDAQLLGLGSLDPRC